MPSWYPVLLSLGVCFAGACVCPGTFQAVRLFIFFSPLWTVEMVRGVRWIVLLFTLPTLLLAEALSSFQPGEQGLEGGWRKGGARS